MYQRFKPVRFGGINSGGQAWGKVAAKYGRGGADGVGYMLAPAAGHYPPSSKLLTSSSHERSLLAYPGSGQINNDKISPWVGFVMMDIKGKSLTIRAHALGGATRDLVSYTKP